MTNTNWNRPKKSPLEKHRAHQIFLIEGPFVTKKPGLIHAGKLMCKKCNKLIKWATQEEVDLFNDRYKNQLGLTTTYQVFVDRLHQSKQVKDTRVEYMYLVVPYEEKELVKALGARYDWDERLWYVSTSSPHLQKLKPWIHESDQIRLGLKVPPQPGSLRDLLNKTKGIK